MSELKCSSDTRLRSGGCEIHSLVVWRFSCAFLHAIFRAHLARHTRTHAHKHTKEQSERVWIEEITQQDALCKVSKTAVRCTASITKAFFTVKMLQGLTVHASAYFHLCPSKRTASPEPILTTLTVSKLISTYSVPNLYRHTLYRILYNSDKILENVAQ